MKRTVAVVALLVLVSAAPTQERVPDEKAQEIAKVLVEQVAKATDLQLKTDVDEKKPYAVHGGDRGAMVIPDKKLTADALAKADKDIVPVGHLWFRQVSPYVNGKVTPNDKLRIVKVTAGGEDHALPFCLIGVQKNAKGELELVVYAKDKEPLLRAPLKKIDAKQELPLELQAKREGDTAQLTINILGKYQAVLTVAEQAP